MMSDFILVLTAIDSKDAAQKIADTVVENRLAPSCWISGPIVSTHWWEGKIHRVQEWVCTIRTRKELYPALEQAIKEAHTYEVPGIIATPLIAGSQSYLDWIVSETTTQ